MREERLALAITDPRTGRVTRLGDDASAEEKIPGDLTLSWSLPGGSKELSTELFEDYRSPRDDVVPFADVEAYGAGADPIWRGSIARGPRSAPSAIGEAARLAEDASRRLIVVDLDLSSWQPATSARKLLLYSLGVVNQQDSSIEDDPNTGTPSLYFHANGRAAANNAWSEAVYDAGPGLTIERLVAGLTDRNLGGAVASFVVNGCDTADGGGAVGSGDLLTAAAPSSQILDLTAPFAGGKRVVMCSLSYPATSMTTDVDRDARLYTVAVYGSTTIPHVSRPGAPGVKGDAVLRYLLDTSRSGIRYTDDSIAPCDFVIPDLKWKDEPVSTDAMVADVNRYYQRPWLVRNGILYWADAADLGRVWRCRRAEGASIEDAGFDVELVYNGVVVRYTDPGGTTRYVGPPGSGMTGPNGYSTAYLLDSDDENPATVANRRRWLVVDAGLTTEDGAIRLGAYVLSTLADRRTSGSIELPSWSIFDEAGARAPAYMIQAGDRLLVEDEPGASERLVVDARYSYASRSSSVSLDAPPDRLEAILERLQVNLVGVVS